jgi:hypothetical protein
MVSFFCCFSQTKQKLLTATPKPWARLWSTVNCVYFLW